MGEFPHAVLLPDKIRIEDGTSLRGRLREISRKGARQAKDLALHLPRLLAFGVGPVPRVLLRHRYKELIELVLHLPGLIALSARIRRAGFGYAARCEPVLLFKYLGDYLANSFNTATRLRMMLHHYRTLAARLPELRELRFPDHQLVLWSHDVETDHLSILLCMPANHSYHLEGDLCLEFTVNGVCLHRLSFTCIPGEEAGLERGTALLVGGSQGVRGTASLIRRASKTIGEISPATMLVLAVQALATRLDAHTILGVTAAEQIALRANPEQAKSMYDAFWEMIGGERHGRFYRLPTSVVRKDLSHLSNPHRARARRKRELKKRFLAQIRENAERLLLATLSISAENLLLALRTLEFGV